MFCTKYFAKYIFLQNEKNVNVFSVLTLMLTYLVQL